MDKALREYTETKTETAKVSYFELFSGRLFLVTILAAVIYVMGLLFINGVIVWLPNVMVQNGFSLFSAHSLVNAFVSQHYPEKLRTSAVGFVNSVGRLGGIFGPTLGGLLLSADASIAVWFGVFGGTGLIAAVSFVIINIFTKYRSVNE